MNVTLNTDICPIVIPDTYESGFQYDVYEDMWDDFKRLMVDIGVDFIKEAIETANLPINHVVGHNLKSPKQYNYGTDWFEFSLSVPNDYIETIKSEVDNDFFRFAKNNFGSYSGFISSMPYTRDKFMESDDIDYIIAMWVLYKVSLVEDLDRYQQEYIQDVYEEAESNGYIDDGYDDEEYL